MPADNHNHILKADIRDMVEAAKRKGINEYSVTEHVSQFKGLRKAARFGSVHSSGKMFEDFDEYTKEFLKVRNSEDRSMEIRAGLEVDYSPRYESMVGDSVNQKRWDILICSAHEFEDGSEVEASLQGVDQEVSRAKWSEYIKLELRALESDYVPFDVLTHPVRLARSGGTVPEDIDDLLLGLAKTARRNDKALELNGKDFDYSHSLVKRLAKACATAGCRVSYGSDAHSPTEVARNIDKAIALGRELDLQIA